MRLSGRKGSNFNPHPDDLEYKVISFFRYKELGVAGSNQRRVTTDIQLCYNSLQEYKFMIREYNKRGKGLKGGYSMVHHYSVFIDAHNDYLGRILRVSGSLRFN